MSNSKNRFAFLFVFTAFLVSLFAVSTFAGQSELDNDSVNVQRPADKKDLPKSILVKKDAEGNIYIYKSNSVLDPKTAIANADFDKLNFVKVGKQSVAIEASATPELDNDKPRQSWYALAPYAYAAFYGAAFLSYSYNYGGNFYGNYYGNYYANYYGYYGNNWAYAAPLNYYGYGYYPYQQYYYGPSNCSYVWFR